ncbi:hypothetical protein HDG37_002769 [Paraburkholderia sp. MM5384-R2]|nr:hypothetical protein [Paraburkholderia sp. MM5384-R2]
MAIARGREFYHRLAAAPKKRPTPAFIPKSQTLPIIRSRKRLQRAENR